MIAAYFIWIIHERYWGMNSRIITIMETGMKYIERKKQILSYLTNGNGVGDITNMCKKLYVSRSTLRRD